MTLVQGDLDQPGGTSPGNVRIAAYPTQGMFFTDAGVLVSGSTRTSPDPETGEWELELAPTPEGASYDLVFLPDDPTRAIKLVITVPATGGPYPVQELVVPGTMPTPYAIIVGIREIEIGTVTAGVDENDAEATLAGSAPSLTLDLVLPRGLPGPVLVGSADFDTASGTWPARSAPRMFWVGGDDAHTPPLQPGDVWVRNS